MLKPPDSGLIRSGSSLLLRGLPTYTATRAPHADAAVVGVEPLRRFHEVLLACVDAQLGPLHGVYAEVVVRRGSRGAGRLLIGDRRAVGELPELHLHGDRFAQRAGVALHALVDRDRVLGGGNACGGASAAIRTQPTACSSSTPRWGGNPWRWSEREGRAWRPMRRCRLASPEQPAVSSATAASKAATGAAA
jgi:hypothetical protein